MIVTVNGESQEVLGTNITIAYLLTQNKVESPEMVSVQRNGEFVDRRDYESTAIAENDEIDFLYFMGGGSR